MRILFTTMPVPGHLRPLVPVAQAASRRGHDVMVCTPASAKDQVEAYGLRHLPGGYDWVGDQLRELNRLGVLPPRERVRPGGDLSVEGMAGPAALRLARDVLAAAGAWRPDLVVRENSEFGGYLAAEVLGVPHASVGASGGRAGRLAATLAPALDVLRGSLGLPPDPTGARAHAYRHVSFVPAVFQPEAMVLPQTRRYRQTSPVLPGERLPDWLAGPPGGRPLVLAAFGTIFPRLTAWADTVRQVIAGLAEVDCEAVVAVGDHPPGGTPPANVRLVDRVPQPLVLECCDLFVTHGGFNSVREALRLGVPMVILPWLTDGPANAARCAELGIAQVIAREALTPAAVSGACASVLGDPAYRRRAAAVRRRMLALPGMEALVSDLEQLGTSGSVS